MIPLTVLWLCGQNPNWGLVAKSCNSQLSAGLTAGTWRRKQHFTVPGRAQLIQSMSSRLFLIMTPTEKMLKLQTFAFYCFYFCCFNVHKCKGLQSNLKSSKQVSIFLIRAKSNILLSWIIILLLNNLWQKKYILNANAMKTHIDILHFDQTVMELI